MNDGKWTKSYVETMKKFRASDAERHKKSVMDAKPVALYRRSTWLTEFVTRKDGKECGYDQ